MSVIFLTIAASAAYVQQLECVLAVPETQKATEVIKATMNVEYFVSDYAFVDLTVDDEKWLSAPRQRIDVVKDDNGLNRFWPAVVKSSNGSKLKIDLAATPSTHTGYNMALLLSVGGDFVVAGHTENDEEYVAVGICTVEERSK